MAAQTFICVFYVGTTKRIIALTFHKSKKTYHAEKCLFFERLLTLCWTKVHLKDKREKKNCTFTVTFIH